MKGNWRRLLTAVLAVAVAGTLAVAGSSTASATRAACGITWGSGDKNAGGLERGPLTNVRSGQQDCYDRLVLDFAAPGAHGYSVRYVPEVVEDGSGRPVPLRGGAKLQITAYAPAYDDAGHSTYNPPNRAELVNVTGYQTFRQVAWAGSFEGYTTIGLGVRARLPFRVSTLDGPGTASRIVIDVAHTW
ncbi:hypothetical protein [Actinokineospora sp. NBRC 105648]|uniref:AMIN-like domain-containing (lipo)protein n=1 Tax=Actinokineospora sp. NBRC 105648 TaxID=3032206 RepID=UPI0024A38385|nr:hypothetical protein [Actinokineospora sp. NBRC 105648]GLZ38575.1 hypothetical protein Acsp05_21990 [Actinokineospora sp. NBRC 105648]